MTNIWRDKTVTVSRRRQRTLCGVRVSAQLPVIERDGSFWYLWLSYDEVVEAGVRLLMRPDGSICRQRVSHTGEVHESFEIAPTTTNKKMRQKLRRGS